MDEHRDMEDYRSLPAATVDASTDQHHWSRCRAGPFGTWKAVYDPQVRGTGAYVCENTAAPSCAIASVAALTAMTGVDPFPALPASIKHTAMLLPRPEDGRLAIRQHRERPREPRNLLEQLLPL